MSPKLAAVRKIMLHLLLLGAVLLIPIWPVSALLDMAHGDPPPREGRIPSLLGILFLAIEYSVQGSRRHFVERVLIIVGVILGLLAGTGVLVLSLGSVHDQELEMERVRELAAVTVLASVGWLLDVALIRSLRVGTSTRPGESDERQ